MRDLLVDRLHEVCKYDSLGLVELIRKSSWIKQSLTEMVILIAWIET